MKYTSSYINSLSFDEYRGLIVKELNENGYRVSGNKEYEIKDYLPKNALILDAFDDPQALDFLKSLGLVDNGRCPFCGAPMSVSGYYWYDRRNPSKKVQVCYGCNKSNGRGDGHSMDGCPSGAPKGGGSSSGSGCMIGLFMLPTAAIAKLLYNLFN